jgi:hypothetical protein
MTTVAPAPNIISLNPDSSADSRAIVFQFLSAAGCMSVRCRFCAVFDDLNPVLASRTNQ